ncbi:alpha/beta fold hydrolase [Leucobacter denitrificans]|uniref:Alpha/beta hydrolase n=1 Tax=Leucobacter denitrificans TaxID=683042 RepID=A0A7G9S564_9MICO|nr:alpha/beta hydrolase [Leucobacter denitrificans]QNN62989.1 alpha/beta hydrolase [Leucobacter denitrificans]
MATIHTPRTLSLQGDGLTLTGDYWEGTGDSTLPTLIFLHGGGQTRHSWDSTADSLVDEGWNSYTVDLRGHGDSGWSEDGTYSIESYARDTVSLVRSLGGNPPVLVGASMGGLASLTAQSDNPELARALVLVDIVPRTATEGVKRITDFMVGHSDGFANLDEVADAIAEYTGRERRLNVEGLKKNVRLRADGRWYWHWDPRMMQPNAQSEGRVPDADALLKRASLIEVPTLIVRGGKSDVIDEEGVKELEGVLHKPYSTVVSNARHMIAGDDNKSFASAVNDFLKNVVLASPSGA